MANISFEDYYGEIALEVPNAPDLLFDRALVYAARTFCKDAQVWRETLDPVAVSGNSAELDLPTQSEVVRPIWAKLGDKPLNLVSDHELQETFGDVPKGVLVMRAQALIVPVEETFSTDQLLTIRAALSPTRSATSIPEAIGDEYFEAMISGAVNYLASQKGRDWFDPDTAAAHGTAFSRMISRARRKAGDGGAHVKRSVTYGGL